MAAVPVVSSGGTPAPTAPTSRVTPLAVGVIVWLASELMFFAGLFAAYYTLRADNAIWPPPGVDLDVLRALLSTVVLLASSATMHAATQAAEHGRRATALRWLAVTFALGVVFLVNLGLEWAGNDFTWTTDAYGSIYYLITGFHGLHLLVGLVLMIVAAAVVTGATAKVPFGPAFTATAYYWHFVDAVWLAVFATIFLVQ
jgi:cytochrome c oxidase subunit 3